MPNLPIFSQSRSVKGNLKSTVPAPASPNSNFNTMPFFFAFPPQMVPFAQNSTIISPNLSSSPKNSVTIPSFDEFFAKLDELSLR